APATPELLKRMRAVLPCPILFRYASTESGPCTSTRADDPDEVLLNTVGSPTAGCEVRVVKDSGEQADPGEVGRIWVRNEARMRGYWGDPEGSAQVLVDEGWVITGDLGRLRADGN